MEITTRITTSIKFLAPELDGEAAALLARCPAIGSIEAAADEIARARADEDSTLLAVIVEDAFAGAYILHKVAFSNEIRALTIASAHERKGYGKMCLYDALFRSGKRPVVVEADDSNVEFFKHCGFKLVGKRKRPDGSVTYRLGWHAPMPNPDGTGEVIC